MDDHAVVREGLCALFGRYPDLEVIGEAANSEAALAQFGELQPDITIIDLRLPRIGGIELIRLLRIVDARARLIVLTSLEGDADVRNAIAAGASGFLLKGAEGSEVVEAIRQVHAGHTWISREALALIKTAYGPDLTARELEVLGYVAMGMRNQEIAERLKLSLSTVKVHVLAILAKLDAQDRTEAVVTALKRGLIHLP